MPMANIQIVLKNNAAAYPDNITSQLADALGSFFNCSPGTTWVRLSYLTASHYAENQISQQDCPDPVFVELLLKNTAEQHHRALDARKIANIVAEILQRPENEIHIIFQPPGVGRVAFGGKLIPDTD